MSIKQITETMNRFKDYSNKSDWSEWLEKNLSRVKELFENVQLRDFIFEPFKGVFTTPMKTVDENIYSVITQVAIINAVLAGLPGKMGVGVFVSMALEAWMAYSIAKHVGINIKTPKDVASYFSIIAGVTTMILWGFKTLLGLGFSLFSIIPELNPLIVAEIFVTNFVGILFWFGFKEAKETNSFQIPKRLIPEIFKISKGLFNHQMKLLKNVFNMENIKSVGRKLAAYLKGEIPINQKEANGGVMATAMMGYLMTGHYEKLQGPLGEEFLNAIRLRWSGQLNENASAEDIAELFRKYEPEQIEGVINTIKGKMFEIIVEKAENIDNDTWKASMHDDESYPGSDIIFTNINGDTLEVSLKAVDENSTQIIEHALSKYPNLPIMTTEEMAKLYEDHPMVFGSSVSNEELKNITEDRFDELINKIQPIDATEVVFGGVTMSTSVLLYPFVIAYLNKRITQDQLQTVFKKVLQEQGVVIATRLTYAVLFGPLFAWYLLAKGIKGIVDLAETDQNIHDKRYYLVEYKR